MPTGWKLVKVFPRCYFEPCWKLGCTVWKLLELALDNLSLLTASHHYCFRDDFQSSLLFLWWLPVITTRSTLKQHTCWLPVIIIVSIMTSSHHNKCNRGIPCEEPISVQWLAVTSYSCWLEVIGLLAHVRIKIRPQGRPLSGHGVGL